MKPGGKLMYEFAFVSVPDATISFGPRVETQEHANACMYFFPGPADGHAFYDMDGNTWAAVRGKATNRRRGPPGSDHRSQERRQTPSGAP